MSAFDCVEPLDTCESQSYDLTFCTSCDVDVEEWDVTAEEYDLDGDGVTDASVYEDPESGATVYYADTDGDGALDSIGIDTDGDGYLDVTVVDTDGDQIPDSVGPGDENPTVEDATDEETTVVDPYSVLEDDPVEATDEDVHGDPADELEYHQVQPDPAKDCLPTSIAMVVSEVTGDTVPASEVVALAEEQGVLGPDGMLPADGVDLLEHYGIEAEVQSGTIDELRTMLDDGTEVIIGLDSTDLASGGDGPFGALDTGHAVVITGIDDEAGVVYLNDPGSPDGAGSAVPIDVFEDAWADMDNTMLVCEDTGDTAAGGTDRAEGWDFALLPLSFVRH